jgi:fructose-1,6-bisphosphatase/inositol monophosphatase family enzyme
VTALLRSAVDEEILPRFRCLEPGEVLAKATPGDPDDIVTTIDRRVEERLTAALRDIAPVLGEEAAHACPSLTKLIDDDAAVWLLDPIDGTKTFAGGGDGFGLMLAFVVGGITRASWVLLPARGLTYVAEEGAGVFRNGTPVKVVRSACEPPRGALYVRYMTPEHAAALEGALTAHHQPTPGTGCAAIEYTNVLEGRLEFAIYHRLHPWDHAPVAFLLVEAGGRVEHLDGTPYGPRSRDQVTIVADGPELARRVRGLVLTGRTSSGTRPGGL